MPWEKRTDCLDNDSYDKITSNIEKRRKNTVQSVTCPNNKRNKVSASQHTSTMNIYQQPRKIGFPDFLNKRHNPKTTAKTDIKI